VIPSAKLPMIDSMDQPQNTSFPATKSSHRGKHELLADYLNRIDPQAAMTLAQIQGRHEAGSLPGNPCICQPLRQGPFTKPTQARITKYEHLGDITDNNEIAVGPHPSWSIDPCPYPSGHKKSCVVPTHIKVSNV